MRKSIVAVAVVAVLVVGIAAAQQLDHRQHDFMDPGGNDALATIQFNRDSSDNPILRFLFTTSDTLEYIFSEAALDVGPNNVSFGSAVGTVDVSLSRGAANRLDLATGDDFNLVSGAVQVGGTDVIDSSGDVQGDSRVVVNCTALAVADQVDQSCFISDRAYTVTRIDQVHTTAESAGTLTIMPKKQEGTEAPSAGQDLLSSGFDGTATAETVQNGSLTGTSADLVLAAGDRVGLDYQSDTAGELAGVVVTIYMDPS